MVISRRWPRKPSKNSSITVGTISALSVTKYPNVVVSEYSCDKNASISEVSIKIMAKLIQNVGGAIAQLKPETLQKVMKALVFLLDGKRPNTKNWAIQICMYVYGLIGNQNYYNLMMYVLSPEEVEVN
jgi:hypothetical protein